MQDLSITFLLEFCPDSAEGLEIAECLQPCQRTDTSEAGGEE